jgi:hypothetical protein
MASNPESTNGGTPSPGEPYTFPSFGNFGPSYIATLSLPVTHHRITGLVVPHSDDLESSQCFNCT